ncbi:squalene synthase isoform X6 [Narcine bancroftii]|uniref:squalene synthase isoform X6 n=1 Tax=Narcine bancroftii TaxID=1343680 RepID=UPI003831CC0F
MYCAARNAWPLALRAVQCDSRRSALPQPRLLLCPCQRAALCRLSWAPCLSCWAGQAAANGQTQHVVLLDVGLGSSQRKSFYTTASLTCGDSRSETLKTCYVYLNQTSRSFAAVIQALDGDLRQAVCIFYLVLRALDTVEDDMSIPLDVKVPMLQNFHTYLYQPEWRYSQSQEKDGQVLADFPSVWSKYAEKLSDFTKPSNIQAALQCLNDLITNALQHVPDVIKYLSRLHNQSVFNFCAIPQVMAIATLAACYNNPQVFRGVVKIRKGQAVTLMLEATNMEAVKGMFRQYSRVIGRKVPSAGRSGAGTWQIVMQVESLSQMEGELMSRSYLSPIYLSLAMFLVAVSWQYWQTLTRSSEEYRHSQ